MGRQERYSASQGKKIRNRANERAALPQPVGLTKRQVDPEKNAITSAARPIEVEAWVVMALPPTPIRIEGYASRWTSRAVEVTWRMTDGREFTVWVPASSVDRVPPEA